MNAPSWTLQQLSVLLGAELRAAQPQRIVRRMATDSRTTQTEPALFWALSTPSGDGHRHLAEAAERGCVAAVVSASAWADVSGLDVLVVADVWEALYRLAAAHRAAYRGPVVAITGSNGKTSVKEQLAHLLGDPTVARSPRSYNSKLGVPLSVLQFPLDASMWIVEVGISQQGDMARFTPWLHPTHGIFTGLGDAHDAGFANREAKLAEKWSLFGGVQALLVAESFASANELTSQLATQPTSQRANQQFVPGDFLRAEGARWIGPDGQVFAVPTESAAERSNAQLALAACYALGRVPHDFDSRPRGPLRVERRAARWAGGALLVDRYALDEASAREALELLIQEPASPKTALIFDADSARWDAAVARWKQEFPAVELHVVAPQDSALEWGQDGAVLLKGHGVEAAVEARSARQHDSYVELDVDALAANLRHYRSKIPAETRIMAMIKANAYGLGAVPVARALERHRLDYLGVAYPEEGRELREAGIRTPIMVLNPGDPSFELMLRYRLEPELFSWERLRAFAEAYARHPEALGEVLVHVKVDTGMHRLGFAPHEGRAVAEAIRAIPGVRVASVLSHFAAAEDPVLDAFTRQQWAAFSAFADDLERGLGIKVWRHMANTAAVARHPWAAGDMVRLGIGLMGASLDAADAAELQPVVQVTTTVSQLRWVPAGEGLSYGCTDVASTDRLIATLPIGYADGIPRALSNGRGRAFAHGRFMPIAGRVCMDMLMVDATGVDLAVGDRVELLGPHVDLESVAAACGTLSYEVLTGLSPRLPRLVAYGL
ncbi:MAG: alanine racemase [Schleiferiaceae bacterium]